MSSSTIVVIAIVAAVFLAFLMVLTTSRRRDGEKATGTLSRETIRKDRSEETAAEVLVGAGQERPQGREIERLARTEAMARPAVAARSFQVSSVMRVLPGYHRSTERNPREFGATVQEVATAICLEPPRVR